MSTTSSNTPGFGRGRRVSDSMTREHLAFFDSSYAAERAGDAATALEYHRGIPMFARSSHRVLLTQLAGLADEMTPWLWARWAAYQCTRVEDPGTEGAEIQAFALDYTLRMFYGEDMAAAYQAGDDPVPFIARVCGQDWAFHQLCTHELDGLECFLDTLATGRLAQEAALAWSWTGIRMGGYQVVTSEPGTLVVRDLADDRRLSVLDLGAQADLHGEGWVLGRLVPSGTTPGLMFDTRPLPVDEQTAREAVEGTLPGAWVAALDHAIKDGRFDRSLLQSEDRELVTDVPSLSLVTVGTPLPALTSTLEQLRQGRDEVGRASYRILRSAAEGSLGPAELAPYVAAAVLNPHGFDEARRDLTRHGHRSAWSHWAELVCDPARTRLELLAELSGPVAA